MKLTKELLITEEKLKEITRWKVVYQRLKKRIAEIKSTEAGYYVLDEGSLKRELQKILDG